MSTTRHATDGSFHQERWCSDSEFGRGLLANLVAKRCEALSDATDRELIWSVQMLSHQEGLEKVSADLLARYQSHLGTETMRRVGIGAGQVYTPEQADAICGEIAAAGGQSPLVGQMSWARETARLAARAARARYLTALAERRPGIDQASGIEVERPRASFTLSEIVNWKEIETEALPRQLAQLCMEPTRDLARFRPWYFPSLVECLGHYLRERLESQRRDLVPTELSRQVHESLDFVLEAGGMAILDGSLQRVGKSYAAKTWCAIHPGRARYCQVPATNDDIGFFRAIAEAVGSASALSFKGVQLRERIEMTLHSAKLMLVLDNAQYIWPQNNRREALPNRLNWLLTTLVNRGVPVALLTTPQFARDQKIVEKKTGWSGAQFLAQVGEYKKLPERLTRPELEAIAAHCLPAADKKSVRLLAAYAQCSGRFLSAVEAAVKRARFIAGQAGRASVSFADVKEAIEAYVIPSDAALQRALGQAGRAQGTLTADQPAEEESGGAAILPALDFSRGTPRPGGARNGLPQGAVK